MSALSILLGEIARWFYLCVGIMALMGSFVHLHMQFDRYACKDYTDAQWNSLLGKTPKVNCLGRSLAWLKDDTLKIDINRIVWRSVFSFNPSIFFDIWTPLILSIMALCQCIKGLKWDLISGSWCRAFIFILIWQLFGVFGYGGNWGVFTGFVGCLGLCLIYLVMIVIGASDDCPVLQLNVAMFLSKYLGIDSLLDKKKQNKNNNDKKSTNNNNNNNKKNKNKNSNNQTVTKKNEHNNNYNVVPQNDYVGGGVGGDIGGEDDNTHNNDMNGHIDNDNDNDNNNNKLRYPPNNYNDDDEEDDDDNIKLNQSQQQQQQQQQPLNQNQAILIEDSNEPPPNSL